MKACPNCHLLNDDSAKSCYKCGAVFEDGGSDSSDSDSSCAGCILAIIGIIIAIALIAFCTGSCGSASNSNGPNTTATTSTKAGKSKKAKVKKTRAQRIQELPKAKRYAQKAHDTGYSKGLSNLKRVYKTGQSNEIKADDKYSRKRIVVAARINKISNSGNLVHPSSNPVVTVEFKVGNTKCFSYLEFNSKSQRKFLRKLSEGGKIVVSGKCYGWGHWYNCYVAHNYL